MNIRSWTGKELVAAYIRGKKIFYLDTANTGGDDVLFGDSYREVLEDVLENIEASKLPEGWSLDEIGEGDEPLYSLINDYEEQQSRERGGGDEPRVLIFRR